MSEKEMTSNKERSTTANSKKEKPTKEKKIIPKYYAGTDIKKLPKIPKAIYKDLQSIETLKQEEIEKYLTAVVLGIIPDKFGLEVGMDTKLKALKQLQEINESKQKDNTTEEMVVIVDDID